MERDFAFFAAARNVDHHAGLLAEARIEGVGQQYSWNAQTFCFTQRGLPLPVRGFLRHHHQHVAALKRNQLLGKPYSGTVKRRGG